MIWLLRRINTVRRGVAIYDGMVGTNEDRHDLPEPAQQGLELALLLAIMYA